MAHVMLLALGAFMSYIGVNECTKSSEAHVRHQQFEDTESTDIGKCQTPRSEGNARINKVSDMRPGLAKNIEKVHISSHFK
jgi:hypothetical protein